MTIDIGHGGGNLLNTVANSASHRLDRTISSQDSMFAGDEDHYFSTGRSAILGIKRAIACASDDFATSPRILDLPCGHGRVLRHLRAEFPNAEITACDLLRGGVDFCAATFGAIPVYSDPDPSRIELPRNAFDLIWVGSLFTHFDAPRWKSYLSFMRGLLAPRGILVFSTHGRRSHEILLERPEIYGLDKARCRRLLSAYLATGFGYAGYRHGEEYGVSISEPAWVCRQITSLASLRLIGLFERAWDNHQDVFACVHDDECRAQRTRSKFYSRFAMSGA
jgi:SAM-dependent methyltransferase